jgi:hypothetical protein
MQIRLVVGAAVEVHANADPERTWGSGAPKRKQPPNHALQQKQWVANANATRTWMMRHVT